MDALFSDDSEIGFMLTFESALARAQAIEGVIPEIAASVIETVCKQTDWDTQALAEQTLLAGNPAIPFVSMLTKRVQSQDAEAATFVHWGATSQDVMDTALMLQLKKALGELNQELHRLQDQLADLARNYRDTPMIGRTLLQQARPITFGFKVAGWLESLRRSNERLQRVRTHNLTLQLGGAVGTLASMGEKSTAVSEHLATQLGLKLPVTSWHSHRDGLVEIATTLGLLNGSLGKLANDVILLMQTEIGEVREGAAPGKGGSSAMPHKRNPVASTFMVAIAGQTPALVSSLLSGMVQQHERAAGAWHAEWPVIRSLVKHTAANLRHANDLISGLEVDTERMKQNLNLTKGLIFAEDVTTALALRMGKAKARTLVEQACQDALAHNLSLSDVLQRQKLVTDALSKTELNDLFKASRAVGCCHQFVDAIVFIHKQNS